MNPFFNNPDSIARLQTHANAWIGTPFMPNASIRGAGVSCQKLVGAIYVELGVVPLGFSVPEGPMDWSNAQTKSLIADFMGKLPMFEDLGSGPGHSTLPGDMIGFQMGGCVHHCGIVIDADGTFIHCFR